MYNSNKSDAVYTRSLRLDFLKLLRRDGVSVLSAWTFPSTSGRAERMLGAEALGARWVSCSSQITGRRAERAAHFPLQTRRLTSDWMII